MIDISCLIVIIFSYLSDLMLFFVVLHYRRDHSQGDFESFLRLEPERIQDEFEHRQQHRATMVSAGLMNAFSWLILCIPILQVAWIQSKQGSKKMTLHLGIAVFAIIGSFTEFIAQILLIGVSSAAQWIASSFNLDDWSEEGSDGYGWRSLEVTWIVSHGMVVWIDAVEWLFLAGIMFMVYASVRSSGVTESPFTQNWARLSLLIGFVCFADFAADLLRLESWRTFMAIAQLLAAINRLILLPLWLFWLGRSLTKLHGEDPPTPCPSTDQSQLT